MQSKIPEIEAREILSTYEGFNNQLIEWKRKLSEVKGFQLTRPQAEYVLKYHEVVPRVAKKYISIVDGFADKLMESKHVKVIWHITYGVKFLKLKKIQLCGFLNPQSSKRKKN